ncbi:MAG: Hsp70 family protein [Desulfobacterales bacterium]
MRVCPPEIQEVILVGGMTRMPAVQQYEENFWQRTQQRRESG